MPTVLLLKIYDEVICKLFYKIVGLDEDSADFKPCSIFDHPYPCTKIMWIPDPKGVFPDLLATSGDYLRLWRVVRVLDCF